MTNTNSLISKSKLDNKVVILTGDAGLMRVQHYEGFAEAIFQKVDILINNVSTILKVTEGNKQLIN